MNDNESDMASDADERNEDDDDNDDNDYDDDDNDASDKKNEEDDNDNDLETDNIFDENCFSFIKSARKTERPTNEGYLFDIKHPMYKTHWQVVRSKQKIPNIVGRIPLYPHNMDSKKAFSLQKEFALMILTLFDPWSIDTFIPQHMNNEMTWWESFISLLRDLAKNKLTTSLLDTIHNFANNSKCSSNKKKLHSLFRTRGTVLWNDLKKNNFLNEEYIEGLNASNNDIIDDNDKNIDDLYYDDADEIVNDIDNAALVIITRAILQGLDSPGFVTKDLIYMNKLEMKMKQLFDFSNNQKTTAMINKLNSTSTFQYQAQFPIASHTDTIYDIGTVKRCQQYIKKKAITVTDEHDIANVNNDEDDDDSNYDNEPININLIKPKISNATILSFNRAYQLDLQGMVDEQKHIVTQIMTYLIQQVLYFLLPEQHNKPNPIYLLIHGGPGNGKSYILKSISKNFIILVERIKANFNEADYQNFMQNKNNMKSPTRVITRSNPKKTKTNVSDKINHLNNFLCITATTGKQYYIYIYLNIIINILND
jgi:hypothetical protein